jgi:hypothetical protein
LFSVILNNILLLSGIGAGVIILSCLLLIFLYTFVLESRGKQDLPDQSLIYPPPPEADVELLLKEVVYEYLPDGQNMCQRKHFQVRALRPGVILFPDRYRWTGAGSCVVKSLTPGFIVANERREEFWEYFDIKFPHPIHQGEDVDFTIEWKLFDEKRVSVPFLSTMIDFNTRHLSMRVILPPELKPVRAYAHDFANYIDVLPMTTQELKWNSATNSLSYEVPQPKKNHKYLISWYNT